MAMNRETKRLLQKQGQLSEDGSPKASRRPAPSPNAPREPRTKPRQFVREVNAELRKVAWPTRQEVINSTIVVLIAVVVMTALIFGFDYASAKAVLFLYD